MPEQWVIVYMNMIEDCEEQESKLNDWERQFISNIKTRLESETPLSGPQTEKLEQIHERISR